MINPIRFGGMASGLDTDKLISDLMKVERMPIDKLNQQKQTLMWQREEYRNMNSTLSSFQKLAGDLRFSASFNKLSATSSDSTVITADASISAGNGSYVIKVDALATSSTNVGDAFPAAVDLKAKGLTAGTFKIAGREFKVTADSTRESVMAEVNKANIGVRMSFDSINGRFMLTSTSTGQSSSFAIDDSSGVLAGNFNLAAAKTKAGQNAKVTVNGASMELANNAFEFNGVRFDLKGVSTSEVTVSVNRDTQNLTNQIKDFVNKYNDLVDKLQSETTEKPNRNYKPLSEEEKAAMTDKQIDLWESKAKAGLMYRDDILQDAMRSLRQDLLNGVKGLPKSMDSLEDIGITFKKFEMGGTKELGKLELNEQKLQDAINKDPNAVMELFTKTSTKDKKDPDRKLEMGFAERVYESLTNSINKITKKIGSGKSSEALDNSLMGKRLYEMNNKMDSLERRASMAETRYYKQFTAMEKALQKLNSQGSWLSQQLGQG
ncbi:flagellar filament capping protein FliD [Paenibacillus assamensis]|uniref:flagellar filament capping protein FliD n=1 Tax=Paenibacillus assamensis TaxID=311244 RepID=UPI000402A450|nr:flagellar filament capping protein FliD [Paenibacillus assamensis]